jgi:hypothetical protein
LKLHCVTILAYRDFFSNTNTIHRQGLADFENAASSCC